MRRNLRRISLFSLLAIVIGLAGMVPAGATLSLLPDDTWGASNQVSVILRVGGTIYLGGEFTALEADSGATMARNHLAAIDAATGEPTSFNPNVSGPVFGLAASPDGSRLYAVGNFTTVGGQARKMVAAFDLPSGTLSSWKPAGSPNTVVRAVAVTAGQGLHRRLVQHPRVDAPRQARGVEPGRRFDLDHVDAHRRWPGARHRGAGNAGVHRRQLRPGERHRPAAVRRSRCQQRRFRMLHVFPPDLPDPRYRRRSQPDLPCRRWRWWQGGRADHLHGREALGEEDRRQRAGRQHPERRAVLRRALLQVHVDRR